MSCLTQISLLFLLLMHCLISAENGCFIKTLPTRENPSEWISMVANFNLSWKGACMEILNYVRPLVPARVVMG